METKFCPRCQQNKAVGEFFRNKCRANGLQDYCKECSKNLIREWMKNNPSKAKQIRQRAEKTPNVREYRRRQRLKRPPGERYRQLIKRGTRRGIEIAFTKDEFIDWFPKGVLFCHYCRRELGEYKNGDLWGLTIDRLDNNKPYELGNIAIACRRCNSMKGSWLTEEQMLDAAQRYLNPTTNIRG